MTFLQHSDDEKVPIVEIDEIAQYLKAADATAFRTTCEGADRKTFHGVCTCRAWL